MTVRTPTDSFDRPAILGNCNGVAVPIKVGEDGCVCVSVTSDASGSASAYRHELVRSIRLDLSVAREKELYDVEFDSFAAAVVEGSFSMYIGSDNELSCCTIEKCMSVGVSASKIYISNAVQDGFAELWFFRIKEDS